MSQAVFSVRMDAALKRQVDGLCQDFGMTPSTAINVFARAVVREKRIPFTISASPVSREEAQQAVSALRQEAKDHGLQDMTLDDVNAEIALARQERRRQ
ncbi:MAG: type II toxin-antitoxin system RelB/DinJ family antitoxin [Planctomycetes bacterium]|nr:type II toxin-antitoxin system RelB/DinJ family antitoxin [Planctomycetota bacterium]